MKICCMSDLHGNLPKLKSADYDMILIGGDIVPFHGHKPKAGAIWIRTQFNSWVKKSELSSCCGGW